MRITVVGQGYVGLPISICAAEAGHTVFGFDIDQDKISKLKLGITDSPEVSIDKLLDLQLRNKISFSSSINDGSGSSIFIIAVPTPLNSQQKPDLSFLTSACELIAHAKTHAHPPAANAVFCIRGMVLYLGAFVVVQAAQIDMAGRPFLCW
jgi:UDP-N-acetyl-D-mannosaminuronate dehydrogenase